MKRGVIEILFILILILFPISGLQAASVTVSATGEYIMGDHDTFAEAKVLALQDAKRIVLEKIGTYIESSTQVSNYVLTKDEIKTYTAGIVKVEKLEDKRGMMGKTTVCHVTVSATVDPEDILKKLNALKSTKKIEESAKKLARENEGLQREISKLNDQLRKIVEQKEYDQLKAQRQIVLSKIQENEKGVTLLLSGRGLLEASMTERKRKFDEIELLRTHSEEIADAYRLSIAKLYVEDNGDGTSNIHMIIDVELPGQYIEAQNAMISVPSMKQITLLGMHVVSSPSGGLQYKCTVGNYDRCYKSLLPALGAQLHKISIRVKIGTYEEAIPLEMSEAYCYNKYSKRLVKWKECERNREGKYASIYEVNREAYPIVYKRTYQLKLTKIAHRALTDISAANIKVVYDPDAKKGGAAQKNFEEYFRSAQLHRELGLVDEALKFYQMAIDSDPSKAESFYERSMLFQKTGNATESIKDMISAAKLGHPAAQAYLKKKNLTWEKD